MAILDAKESIDFFKAMWNEAQPVLRSMEKGVLLYHTAMSFKKACPGHKPKSALAFIYIETSKARFGQSAEDLRLAEVEQRLLDRYDAAVFASFKKYVVAYAKGNHVTFDEFLNEEATREVPMSDKVNALESEMIFKLIWLAALPKLPQIQAYGIRGLASDSTRALSMAGKFRPEVVFELIYLLASGKEKVLVNLNRLEELEQQMYRVYDRHQVDRLKNAATSYGAGRITHDADFPASLPKVEITGDMQKLAVPASGSFSDMRNGGLRVVEAYNLDGTTTISTYNANGSLKSVKQVVTPVDTQRLPSLQADGTYTVPAKTFNQTENIMAKHIETITFIGGIKEADASEDFLISRIKQINDEIGSLASLKDDSKYAAAKIMELNSDKVKIIAILDGRAVK